MEAFIRLRAEQQEVEEEEEMLPQVTAGVEGVAGGGERAALQILIRDANANADAVDI